MNFIKTMGVFTLIAAHQLCMAQQETAKASAPIEFSEFTVPSATPCVVIEVLNQKSMQLNAKESQKFIDAINTNNHGMRSIRILSEQEANDKYGISNKNGVIVAQYTDVYKLPWTLQMKFIEKK